MVGKTWTDYVAVFISAGALTFSAYQFYRESCRRKRESTLDAYNQLQEVFAKLNTLLFAYKDDKAKLRRLKPGDDDWERITDYLARIERFSVGINLNIYSIETLNRLGGGYYIRLFDQLEPIITKKRTYNVSKGNHYDEFEATVSELKKMRKVNH